MDTLNSRLERVSAMSTSETHSDKTVSDEEDFKTNIPYFAETNGTSCRQRSNTEEDDDDPPNFNYPNWDNDDGFMDNMSHMEEADYPAYPPGENNNYYPATSPETPMYPHEGIPDIKYSPDEMVFRPPATSGLHYNYPHPRQVQPPPPPPPPPPPHAYPQRPTHMHGGHAAYGAYTHLPPSGMQQPNMWYPNAPYGTGGFGSYAAAYGHGPHRYAPYNAGYTHDPMMDMLQMSNSGREARNRAEKNRRDKLNGSIQELSTMVPHVAESPRRVDKTAVLRFAAHGLRLNYVFGETMNQYRPQVTDALMKLLDSFFITLTCHGQIVLISSSIEQHLGHCQTDLYGQNILHITHPGDHAMLKQQLIPTDLEHLLDINPDDDSGAAKPRTLDEEEYIDRKLREDKRSFTVRLARAGPRSEPTAYEVVKLDGIFRRSDAAPRGEKTSPFTSSLQLIRRTRGRDDSIPLHAISGNDIVLVAIARIIRPPKIINRVMESNALEYKTRHLIDGRIIDCDQRIGLVAGYMTDEVRNLSPFTFMHQDDVRWVIVALRQMYDCNSSYGESTYRLLTRNGNFIYLQSKGFLEIDKDTNKVHSFVCINTLLDEDEGKRRVQEMKNKFSIIINTKIPQSTVDVPASENPQQLEKAVLCLIQNLQKSASDDEEADSPDMDYASGSAQAPALSSSPEAQRKFATPNHHSMMPSARMATSCASKTPPLALVPPEASTVKTSILKSVSVVNVTAAKHLRDHQRVKSPMSTVDDGDLDLNAQQLGCTCELNGAEFCEFCQASNSQVTPGMKRNMSYAESEDIRPAKRRFKTAEIEQVLSSSLDQIGRSLNEQLNAAIELRDQSNKYDVPNSNQRIEEIMEEHQKQSEIYVNIKSEYEVQIQNKGIDANTTKTNDPQANVDLKQR